MLILAGITLSIAFGENGIFSQSKLAVQEYENARIREEQELQNASNEISNLGVASSRDFTLTQGQYQDLIANISDLTTRVETLERLNQQLSTLGTDYKKVFTDIDLTKNQNNLVAEVDLPKGKYVIIGWAGYKEKSLRYFLVLRKKIDLGTIATSSAYDDNGYVGMNISCIYNVTSDSETVQFIVYPTGKDVSVSGHLSAIKIGNIE